MTREYRAPDAFVERDKYVIETDGTRKGTSIKRNGEVVRYVSGLEFEASADTTSLRIDLFDVIDSWKEIEEKIGSKIRVETDGFSWKTKIFRDDKLLSLVQSFSLKVRLDKPVECSYSVVQREELEASYVDDARFASKVDQIKVDTNGDSIIEIIEPYSER